MNARLLIAGGGIGGLAAALACRQAGADVQVYERAAAFSEAGAGIQLGPNAVRVLQGWGLQAALDAVAVRPARLVARSAATGAELAAMALGGAFARRYGAPYLTLHRADLHRLLLTACTEAGAGLHAGNAATAYSETDASVTLTLAQGPGAQGDALIGADGLWSALRAQWPGTSAAPRATGHLAYRALVPRSALPAHLRPDDVVAWLGQRLHAVQYPVRGAEWVNLVVIVEGPSPLDVTDWDHAAHGSGLGFALAGTCAQLRQLMDAAPQWRLWTLSDRPPLTGPHQMAQGRVALLGDAAHPMPPYLAQGAGMALEDAAGLALSLARTDMETPQRLRQYALLRWQRNARVQARAARNGRIFHAGGPVRWARDTALRVLGARLLDVPWLYRG